MKRKVLLVLLFMMTVYRCNIALAVANETLPWNGPTVYFPFDGNAVWHVVQGNHGQTSHASQPTYYAYDFDLGDPAMDENNAAFGQTVVSPVTGRVIIVEDDQPDFGTHYEFGNFVVIQSGTFFIRVAGLRMQSILVEEGEDVSVGAPIGEVGCSGDFFRPALHMQAQKTAKGDSIRFRFHEGHVLQNGWYTSTNPGPPEGDPLFGSGPSQTFKDHLSEEPYYSTEGVPHRPESVNRGCSTVAMDPGTCVDDALVFVLLFALLLMRNYVQSNQMN